MTTSADRMFEERLQVALHDLADEVEAVELAARLRPPEATVRSGRRRLLVSLSAAAVVLVLVVGSLAWLRPHGPRIAEPVQQPPTVFRVTGAASTAPGRAVMAVTLTATSVEGEGAPAYLVRSADGAVRKLPPSSQLFPVESQRLAAGGRILVRKNQDAVGPANVLVDLESGRVQPIDDADALFLTLSPDGETVAEYTSRDVRLRRMAAGTRQVIRRLSTPAGTSVIGTDHPGSSGAIGAIGWAPAGDLLAVHDGADTLVVDLRGGLRARLRGVRLVNGSQSWSPDGSRILVYVRAASRFSVREADGTGTTVIRAPRGGTRPLGWSGSRVVWLTGAPGSQRLVTCEVRADDCETWMRFDVGAAGVEGVTWSTDLTGTVRR
jgi:hypothetical protein